MAPLDSVVVADGKKASILKPYPDLIRVLRDKIFSGSGPLSPMAEWDPVMLMQVDAARVRVVNGTSTEGFSERAGNYLRAQGMQVVEVSDDAGRQYTRTTVVLYGPKVYALRYLQTIFGINLPSQVLFDPDPSSPVDIEVRLGADALTIIP